MRKIVVEMPRRELEESDYVPGLEDIDSLKIVQLLKYDSKGYAGIVQVKLRPPLDEVKDLVGIAGMTKVQELSKEKDGFFLIYGEGRPKKEWMRLASNPGGYVYPPFELTPDRWRITFIGGEAPAKRFFKMLEKARLHYRIVHATDAKFAASSFLSALTEKQRKVLVSAYEQGFFDTPRRIGVRTLGQSMKLGKSAVVDHLRKAEKRLLDEILAN